MPSTSIALAHVLLHADNRVGEDLRPGHGGGILDLALPPRGVAVDEHLAQLPDQPDGAAIRAAWCELLSARSTTTAARVSVELDLASDLVLTAHPIQDGAYAWLVTASIEHVERPTLARLRSVLSAINGAVLVEDESRRIALVNQQFCDLFEIPAPPDALVGADCGDAARAAAPGFRDPDAFITRVDEILAAADPVAGELVERTDGRVLERDFVWVHGERGGPPIGNVWVYRDVTEQYRDREQLRRNAVLRERMIATTSHELRTPLAGLAGLLELLALDTPPLERARLLHTAQASTTQLMRVVDDLLDVHRLQSGSVAVVAAPFSPARTLRLVVEQAAAAHPEHVARMLFDCHVPPGLELLGDAGRIGQVVLNLVRNALVHGGDGTVRIEAALRDGTLEVSVTDDGPGVDRQLAATAFDPFTRGDTTAPGSGLGLWISRELAVAMGGSVALEVAQSGGTRAVVRLPFHAAVDPVDDLPTLDFDHLAQLERELGSATALRAPIELYLDHVDRRLDALRELQRQGSRTRLADAVHELGSASAVIGASRTSARCRQLERTLRKPDPADVAAPDPVSALEPIVRDAADALRRYASELSSAAVQGPSR